MKKHIQTILSALKWGTRQLKEIGIDNPKLDAEVLLAHCLDTDRVELYASYDRRIGGKDWKRYTKFVARRMKREPVAYITGYKEFYSLGFKLDPSVLIPRPETEILVEETLSKCVLIKEKKGRLNILELGTGSGVIVVTVAKEINNPSIIATDISLEIIKVARGNARLHKVDRIIKFFVSRFLQAIKVKGTPFDLIVSNPPYLSTSDWENVQPEIKGYEPTNALLGGKDGLDFYRKIMPGASELLARDGWLLLEVGMGQADRVSEMIKKTGEFSRVELVNDLSGIPRVVKAKRE